MALYLYLCFDLSNHASKAKIFIPKAIVVYVEKMLCTSLVTLELDSVCLPQLKEEENTSMIQGGNNNKVVPGGQQNPKALEGASFEVRTH